MDSPPPPLPPILIDTEPGSGAHPLAFHLWFVVILVILALIFLCCGCFRICAGRSDAGFCNYLSCAGICGGCFQEFGAACGRGFGIFALCCSCRGDGSEEEGRAMAGGREDRVVAVPMLPGRAPADAQEEFVLYKSTYDSAEETAYTRGRI